MWNPNDIFKEENTDGRNDTLTAVYSDEIYTVTFDANGAEGKAPGPISAEAGSQITIPGPGTLEKTSYTFDSWNTNSDGTGQKYGEGSKLVIGSNIKLYAQWAPIASHLEIDNPEHCSIKVYRSESESGQPLGFLKNNDLIYIGDRLIVSYEADTGYVGESLKINGKEVTSGSYYDVDEEGDVVVSASVKPKTAILTFDAGDGKFKSGSSIQDCAMYYDTETSILSKEDEPIRENYTFKA